MPRQVYAGEQLWAYQKGYAKGREDDRTERGLMNFGGMFAGDDQTARNIAAWRDGFEDGQRAIGLDPAKTFCTKDKYPGADGPRLRAEAEGRAAAAERKIAATKPVPVEKRRAGR